MRNGSKHAAWVFGKNALNYQEKFMDVSLYEDGFNILCEKLEIGARVLDLACGPGNISSHLLHKRPDLKITGVDLAPEMIELARNNNPTAEFVVMDGREIHNLNATFDAIICGFLLPYLSKSETSLLISQTAEKLSTKGMLYLSTMEDDYSKSGLKKGSSDDEIYMYYYKEDYLTRVLQEANLKILTIERKSYIDHNNHDTTDLILIAQKQKSQIH